MLCPHCSTQVSDINDERAWDLANVLDPNNPGSIALNGDDLAATAGFARNQLETVKRHYRDHILPQLGLALAYDRPTDLYWLSVDWIDANNPDIRSWENGGIKQLHQEARHLSDGLMIGYKNIPTSERKKRLLVRDLHSTIAHVVERIDIALESAALK